MHIIVLIKQVPETDKVKMDPETGTMVRSGLESIINPLDLYAIEEALMLKEHFGAHITVISMGPLDAERALRESLAMGCDKAILLTDKAFAGSDTWATSRVLAETIKHIGTFDLILAGERATDGDTGQVGPAVASWLGIPALTYVSSLEIESRTKDSRIAESDHNRTSSLTFLVRRLTEEGYQKVKVQSPFLITVVKEIASPRLPTLRGKKFSRSAEVLHWGAKEINLDPASVGLAGSPTRVVKIFYPKVARGGERILALDETAIDKAIDRILSTIGPIMGDGGCSGINQAANIEKSETKVSLAKSQPAMQESMISLSKQLSSGPMVDDKPEFWIITERRKGGIDLVSLELLARARYLADSRGAILVAIVLGPSSKDEAAMLIAHGADSVILVESSNLKDFICELWSEALFKLACARKPEVILGAATTTGRTLMPYLAAKLGTGLTADCTELSIEEGSGLLLQTRPAIGGNIMATIKTAHHRPQMATVRPHSMQPLSPDFGRRGSIIHVIDDSSLGKSISDSSALSVQVLALESNVKDFENLESAQIVVSGGRGLKKADNFKLIRELALALGGAVGASRESVDRGWISYPHQVGLSGKTISPEIYICAGISGAVQHLAGIRTAKKIISINIDPDAPIHAVADLAIIGDLFEILPRLTAQLKSVHSSSSGSGLDPVLNPGFSPGSGSGSGSRLELDPGFSPRSVLGPGSVSSLGHGSSSPSSSLSQCQTKDTKLQEPVLPRSEILSKEAQHEI